MKKENKKFCNDSTSTSTLCNIKELFYKHSIHLHPLKNDGCKKQKDDGTYQTLPFPFNFVLARKSIS